MEFPTHLQSGKAAHTTGYYAHHHGIDVQIIRHGRTVCMRGNIQPQVLIAGAIGGEEYQLKCFDEQELRYLFSQFQSGEKLFQEFNRVGKWLDSQTHVLMFTRSQ